MSSEHAVHVDRVSKLYRIGAQFDQRTFREAVTDFIALRRRTEEPGARDLWALRDVSFDVRRGEAIGIIGQNGAGKSTLLKILSRITEPTSGRIEVRGRVSSLLEVGTGFHAELTGRENIQLNGAILGMTRKEIRERFDEIVAFAEVERFIDTPVKYYSSGMYMRLAFAVAAHLEPEILVVDEVLAVGDAAFQAKCLRKMNDVASHGRTVLFVSHNMTAVKSLCRAAVWLRQGGVVEIGDAASVVTHYLQHASSRAGLDDVAEIIAAFPEDPVFRLDSITLRQHGQTSTALVNGEPIDVEIAFEVKTTTLGLHVYTQVFDLDEILLFESLHNGDTDAPPRVDAGRYVATMRIPADLLAARPYQLRVHAGIADVRSLIPEPVRINFDVQQTGIVNRAYPGYPPAGRIAPRLDWRVERA
jgi:lipopolysaccharide transport system ATP-binding protein